MGKALEIGKNLARLRKYSAELNAMIEDGSFYRLTFVERFKLVRRVKKLYNRLLGPVSAIKLKHVIAAAGVLALNTACFVPVGVMPDLRSGGTDDPGSTAGGAGGVDFTPYFSFRSTNPYGIIPLNERFRDYTTPGEEQFALKMDRGTTFVDLDGDGDFDLVHSWIYYGGTFNYYTESYSFTIEARLTWQENVGDRQSPSFGPHEPIPADMVPYAGGIAFADMDLDGDQDLWMATHFSSYGEAGSAVGVAYFKNVGSKTSPMFEFQGYYPGYNESAFLAFRDVAVGDMDNDGDLDLFFGETGGIAFHENTGTPQVPQFDFSYTDYSAFGLDEITDYTEYAYQLVLVDIDRDGDLDIVAAGRWGNWVPGYYGGYYFSESYYNEVVLVVNDGNGEEATITDFYYPDGLYSEGYSPVVTPRLVDIDGDGDLDVFASSPYGEYSYIEGDGYYSYGEGSMWFWENLAID